MPPRQSDPQFKLRLDPDLKARLEAAAVENHRSLSAEIIARLDESSDPVLQAERGKMIEALALQEAKTEGLVDAIRLLTTVIGELSGHNPEVPKILSEAIRSMKGRSVSDRAREHYEKAMATFAKRTPPGE